MSRVKEAKLKYMGRNMKIRKLVTVSFAMVEVDVYEKKGNFSIKSVKTFYVTKILHSDPNLDPVGSVWYCTIKCPYSGHRP